MLSGTTLTKEEFLRELAGGDAADHPLVDEPMRHATIEVYGTERAIRRLQAFLDRGNYKAQTIWAPVKGGAYAQKEGREGY